MFWEVNLKEDPKSQLNYFTNICENMEVDVQEVHKTFQSDAFYPKSLGDQKSTT